MCRAQTGFPHSFSSMATCPNVSDVSGPKGVGKMWKTMGKTPLGPVHQSPSLPLYKVN